MISRPKVSRSQKWAEAGNRLKIVLGEDIPYLLPDTDVPLLDEDTGVVDRLGKSKLENLKYYCKLDLVNYHQFSTNDMSNVDKG